MTTERIIRILYKFLADIPLDAGEESTLEQWISENPEIRRRMVDGLRDADRLTEGYRLRSMVDTVRPQAEMERRLGIAEPHDTSRRHNRWSRPIGWLAAATVAAATLAGILWMRHPADKGIDRPAVAPVALKLENLSPGATQAILTTPSGDTLHISDPGMSNPNLARNISDGPLQIDVPRGGEFVVTLEDSTKVWLNSESRLIYPARFDTDSRRVELIGEAFFDVTKNPEAPFIVESAGQRVTVYGTEFNIRCYPEDELIYTTLTSGSISLTPLAGGGELFLSPGKQALFNKATAHATVRPIDIERVTGWRHGLFVFEEQSLDQIMRDLGRWYDFEYEFADPEVAETIFMGSIPRYSNFKTAIAILEKSGGLAFNVRENKVVISRR